MYYRCIIYFNIRTFVPQEFSTKIPHLCVNTTIANKRSSTSMCATLHTGASCEQQVNALPPLSLYNLRSPLPTALDDEKTRSKMMVQVESQRPPIFKVQWVKKRCNTPNIMYIYGIQCDFMPKSPKKQSNNQNH